MSVPTIDDISVVNDRIDRLAVKIGALEKANKTKQALREIADALENLLVVIDAWDEVGESGEMCK